jgi:hypothetical protein
VAPVTKAVLGTAATMDQRRAIGKGQGNTGRARRVLRNECLRVAADG